MSEISNQQIYDLLNQMAKQIEAVENQNKVILDKLNQHEKRFKIVYNQDLLNLVDKTHEA